MKKVLAVLSTVVLTLAFQSAFSIELPGVLVDPAWLSQHKDEVTILQVGPLKSFTTAPEFKTVDGKPVIAAVSGHLPGAHFLDFEEIRIDRMVNGKKVKSIPGKAQFEKLAQSWGVNRDAAIVIVPRGISTLDVDEATRLYWQFKYYGQKNMAILNGGMAAWLAAGYSAATDTPDRANGTWVATGEDRSILATYDDVKTAIKQKNVQLADARPQNQYMGVFAKKDEQLGHIPGAKDMSPDLMTTAESASAEFLPASAYRSMMKTKGLNPDAPTIEYCNTGHLASGLWFVSHEILGNKKSRLYDGSFLEYSVLGGEAVNPAQ